MVGAAEYRYADDGETWAHSYVLPCVREMLRGAAGPILDIGCGNGFLVHKLIEDGFDAYGIDSSASGIEIASRRHPGRFWRTDIESGQLPPPLAAMQFRTVVCTEVIEHLYNPRALVGLAAGILRRSGGGTFIVTTPYHGYLKNVVIALAGLYDRHHTVLWDGGHIKFFSRRTLEALLEESGFAPTAFRGVGRMPFLWKSMVLAAGLSP